MYDQAHAGSCMVETYIHVWILDLLSSVMTYMAEFPQDVHFLKATYRPVCESDCNPFAVFHLKQSLFTYAIHGN